MFLSIFVIQYCITMEHAESNDLKFTGSARFIDFKIGMKLRYTGRVITVREVNDTHVLMAFEDGICICTNKGGFQLKDVAED